MTDAMTNFQRVKQFNLVFGHPAPAERQLNIFSEKPDIVKLRNSLILEEITELQQAIEEENNVEIIDALSDIQYVAYGLLIVYGVDADEEFTKYIEEKYVILDFDRSKEESMKSNFIQTREFIQLILQGVKFDVTPKNFLDFYTNPAFRQLFNNYVDELQRSYKCLETSTNLSNFSETVKATLEIIYITYVIGSLMGVDLDLSIKLVHDSNMSKICSSEEEAIKTVEWYKNNETRYDSPMYRKSDFLDGYVVYNGSTGKILKNINYKPVDLTGFLL